MLWRSDPRVVLVQAVGLDLIGQLVVLTLLLLLPHELQLQSMGSGLQEQMPWLVFMLLLYPLLTNHEVVNELVISRSSFIWGAPTSVHKI